MTMYRMRGLLLLSMFTCSYLLLAQDTTKVEQEFEMEIEGEYRYFYEEALFADQHDHFPSIAVRPQYDIEWDKGAQSVTLEGFFRWDRDEPRTHWDMREMYYQWAKKKWEISVGAKKVFWGVTESTHLVDVINQTDQVESFDGEEKLGQPMIQVSYITPKYGTFEFYHMPYHRKRTFAGKAGRLRFPVVLDQDDLGYESDSEEWNQDFAFHWKHYIGIVDIGLSHFHGTGRDPLFVFVPEGINAFYPLIDQTGLELQVTHNAFLWKAEAIYRSAEAQDFAAAVGGLEYTFGNINRKGLDIGLIAEYLYDERDELTLSGLQNDFFAGCRLGFNDSHDTSILFGGIADLSQPTRVVAVEASRRFGSNTKVELEARMFPEIADDELILSSFKNDGFFRIAVSYYP